MYVHDITYYDLHGTRVHTYYIQGPYMKSHEHCWISMLSLERRTRRMRIWEDDQYPVQVLHVTNIDILLITSTGIKKRVILSFYNVSCTCSLSDTEKKYFLHVQQYFFYYFLKIDLTFLQVLVPVPVYHVYRYRTCMIFWFFRPIVGPLRNMRRKTSSRFPIPAKVGLNRKTGRGFPPHVSQGTPECRCKILGVHFFRSKVPGSFHGNIFTIDI